MLTSYLIRVCEDLFHKIRCSEHCLHDIVPPVISQCYDMRHRTHSYNMYYHNVTVIYVRNLLLIIVRLKTCNHSCAIRTDACTFVACISINDWIVFSIFLGLTRVRPLAAYYWSRFLFNVLLPRCMQCRRGPAMRILSVRPSVCPSQIVRKLSAAKL